MKRLVAALALALALAALVAPGLGAAAAKPVLTVRGSDYGKILFDGRGYVLYAFTRDGKKRSACYGDCARAWPPYLVHRAASVLRVGAGIDARKLGTTKRSDGRLQLTYAGRPLYYYVGDNGPGVIRCQNVSEFGGNWLVVRASGALVR